MKTIKQSMIFLLFILGGCNALQVSSQANQTETPIPSPVVTTTLPPDQCVDMDGNLYKLWRSVWCFSCISF